MNYFYNSSFVSFHSHGPDWRLVASDWSVVRVPASGWLVRARIMVTPITDPQLPRSPVRATGDSHPAPALGSTPWSGAHIKYIYICIYIYRVFFFILIQEWACCELILGVLRSQIGSLGPQDWAQITFR